MHRQRTSGNYSPDIIASIARAYGTSVIDALVTLGTLHPSDISTGQIIDGLRDATDAQLVAEIARRLELVTEGSGSIFDEPTSNVTHASFGSNVSGSDEDEQMSDRKSDYRRVARPRDPEPTDEQ